MARPSSGEAPPDGAGGADARFVLVTAPDEAVARQLARACVEARLAACVNLVPGVLSIYRWQGAVEEARECLLLIKTVAARLSELQAELARAHPYELPEFVVLRPDEVESRYLAWLRAESGA